MTQASGQTLWSEPCKRKKLKISATKLLTLVSVFIHLLIQTNYYRFNDCTPVLRTEWYLRQRSRHRKIIWRMKKCLTYTRVGTIKVATIYLQLIQNRYMFRSFTVLQCSHQHCVQPVASDVEVVGYL